ANVPDPTWIPGMYDGGDADEILALVWDGTPALAAGSPALLQPHAVVLVPSPLVAPAPPRLARPALSRPPPPARPARTLGSMSHRRAEPRASLSGHPRPRRTEGSDTNGAPCVSLRPPTAEADGKLRYKKEPRASLSGHPRPRHTESSDTKRSPVR